MGVVTSRCQNAPEPSTPAPPGNPQPPSSAGPQTIVPGGGGNPNPSGTATSPPPSGPWIPQWLPDSLAPGDVASAKGSGAPGVALFFSGYGASMTHGQQWAAAALQVAPLAKNVSQVWVFRGPNTVAYTPAHFPTQKVAQVLAEPSYQKIYVFSHSSGVFPAEAFVKQAKSLGLGPKLHVYTLDGVYSAHLEEGVALSLGVWAQSKSGVVSRNAASMKRYKKNKGLTCPEAGCSTAWCLHFAMVTPRPKGSIAQDYKAPSAFGLFFIE